MTEHTILVAFTVQAERRSNAERFLRNRLPLPGSIVTSWWVAEDDRQDGSDNDSAVFVHPGAQSTAAQLLYAERLTADCNLVERRSIWEAPDEDFSYIPRHRKE